MVHGNFKFEHLFESSNRKIENIKEVTIGHHSNKNFEFQILQSRNKKIAVLASSNKIEQGKDKEGFCTTYLDFGIIENPKNSKIVPKVSTNNEIFGELDQLQKTLHCNISIQHIIKTWDNASIPIILCSTDLTVHFANRVSSEIFGYRQKLFELVNEFSNAKEYIDQLIKNENSSIQFTISGNTKVYGHWWFPFIVFHIIQIM